MSNTKRRGKKCIKYGSDFNKQKLQVLRTLKRFELYKLFSRLTL